MSALFALMTCPTNPTSLSLIEPTKLHKIYDFHKRLRENML